MPHMTTTTRTTRTQPSFFHRMTHRRRPAHTTHTAHTHQAPRTQPVHHQRRHASLGDKISGALLKLKGELTRRPGVKAAGTKRMRGTDGRGSHRRERTMRRHW